MCMYIVIYNFAHTPFNLWYELNEIRHTLSISEVVRVAFEVEGQEAFAVATGVTIVEDGGIPE